MLLLLIAGLLAVGEAELKATLVKLAMVVNVTRDITFVRHRIRRHRSCRLSNFAEIRCAVSFFVASLFWRAFFPWALRISAALTKTLKQGLVVNIARGPLISS